MKMNNVRSKIEKKLLSLVPFLLFGWIRSRLGKTIMAGGSRGNKNMTRFSHVWTTLDHGQVFTSKKCFKKLNNMRDYDVCMRNYVAHKMNNKNVKITLLDITLKGLQARYFSNTG